VGRSRSFSETLLLVSTYGRLSQDPLVALAGLLDQVPNALYYFQPRQYGSADDLTLALHSLGDYLLGIKTGGVELEWFQRISAWTEKLRDDAKMYDLNTRVQ
jgi:hypothetical protein